MCVPSPLDDEWGSGYLDFLSRYDGLCYFRLTALGAYCLGKTGDYTPPISISRYRLDIGENGEILVKCDPLPHADRLYIDNFARSLSPSLWQVDVASLMTAVERGHDVAPFAAFLSAHADSVPKSVTRLMSDADSRERKLKAKGSATLYECGTAAVAEQVSCASATKKLCSLVGTKTLVVPSSSDVAFRKAILQLGYVLPRV